MSALEVNEAPSDPGLQQLMITHVHDLIALTLGATRDAAEIANTRGGQAARLRMVTRQSTSISSIRH